MEDDIFQFKIEFLFENKLPLTEFLWPAILKLVSVQICKTYFDIQQRKILKLVKEFF